MSDGESETFEEASAHAVQHEWEEVDDGYGNIYYVNSLTGESQWEVPSQTVPQLAVQPILTETPVVPPLNFAPIYQVRNQRYPHSSQMNTSNGTQAISNRSVSVASVPSVVTPSSRTKPESFFLPRNRKVAFGAPTPNSDWEQRQDENGHLFWHNKQSGDSQWEAPAETTKNVASETFKDEV